VRRSSIWFALILIASALLLSAEGPSGKPSPSPNPQTIPQHEQATQADKGKADHNSASLALSQLHAHGKANQNEDQPIEISILKDWSDYGLVVVAALVALITFFQYRITSLAYLVDRPYLIVGDITLHNMTTVVRAGGLAFTTATVIVENAGKRPAVIQEAKGELLLVADASEGGWPITPRDWGINVDDLLPASVEKKVVGANSTIEVLIKYKKNLLSEEDYKAVKMTYDKIIVAIGRIEYRPVAGWRWHRYKTAFGKRYSPAGMIGEKDFFIVGPPNYNRNT
jgi:hypothetical protein